MHHFKILFTYCCMTKAVRAYRCCFVIYRPEQVFHVPGAKFPLFMCPGSLIINIEIQMMLWCYFQVFMSKKLFSSYQALDELFWWSHPVWFVVKLVKGFSRFRFPSLAKGETKSMIQLSGGQKTVVALNCYFFQRSSILPVPEDRYRSAVWILSSYFFVSNSQ
jgi:hypothetical protein